MSGEASRKQKLQDHPFDHEAFRDWCEEQTVALGVTHGRLAAMLGLTRTFQKDLVAGHRAPSLATYVRMCSSAGVPFEEWLRLP